MTHTITLVTDVFLSKAEALKTLSELLGSPVDASDPADAVIRLPEGVVLSIEVPKFGEDLPLTVDLTASDREALERATQEVIDRVRNSLPWSMTIIGQ